MVVLLFLLLSNEQSEFKTQTNLIAIGSQKQQTSTANMSTLYFPDIKILFYFLGKKDLDVINS